MSLCAQSSKHLTHPSLLPGGLATSGKEEGTSAFSKKWEESISHCCHPFPSATSHSVFGLTGIMGEKSWKMQPSWRMPCAKGGTFQVCPLWFLLWCGWRGVFQGPRLWGHIHGGRGAEQHLGTGPVCSVISILSPSWRLWVLGSHSGLKWSLYSTGWGGGLYPGQASLSWVWNVPSQVVTSLEVRPWCCFTCLEMIIFFVVNKGQESCFYEWWKGPELKCFQKSPLRIGFFFFFVLCP